MRHKLLISLALIASSFSAFAVEELDQELQSELQEAFEFALMQSESCRMGNFFTCIRIHKKKIHPVIRKFSDHTEKRIDDAAKVAGQALPEELKQKIIEAVRPIAIKWAIKSIKKHGMKLSDGHYFADDLGLEVKSRFLRNIERMPPPTLGNNSNDKIRPLGYPQYNHRDPEVQRRQDEWDAKQEEIEAEYTVACVIGALGNAGKAWILNPGSHPIRLVQEAIAGCLTAMGSLNMYREKDAYQERERRQQQGNSNMYGNGPKV